MSDQCRKCVYRGDLKGCESVECTHHESWYVSVKKDRIEALEAEYARFEEASRKELDKRTQQRDRAEKRLWGLEKATLPLHRKIVAFQDRYNADDCFVIDEAIALDIMALGGDDSALAALLEGSDGI